MHAAIHANFDVRVMLPTYQSEMLARTSLMPAERDKIAAHAEKYVSQSLRRPVGSHSNRLSLTTRRHHHILFHPGRRREPRTTVILHKMTLIFTQQRESGPPLSVAKQRLRLAAIHSPLAGPATGIASADPYFVDNVKSASVAPSAGTV
jgi:hypothetical protein